MNTKPANSVNQSSGVVKSRKSSEHLEPKSREFLCGLFNYDPKDGRLLRKNGKEAGSKKCRKRDGHRSTIQVCLTNEDGTWNLHSAHRIIYQMMGVDVPDGMVIDHKNNDPWDNRWNNLRLVTQKENCRNRGASHGKTTKLPRCVFGLRNGTFFVSINSSSKETVESATEWRNWARKMLKKVGIYTTKERGNPNKASGLPSSVYHTWSGGVRKGFVGRIHQGGFKSSKDASDWRNQAEIVLFGEVLHKGSE